MKKYVMSIFAAAIALSLSAFTAKSKHESQTYSYTGASFTMTDVSNASNWKIGVAPTPEQCGGSTEVTCTIQLPTGFANASGELDGAKAQVQPTAAGSDVTVSNVVDLQSPGNPAILQDREEGARPE